MSTDLVRAAEQAVAGALLRSRHGRGADLFGPSDGDANHDSNLVREVLAADAVAGSFAGGEIGPVAGRRHLRSFTASVLVCP